MEVDRLEKGKSKGKRKKGKERVKERQRKRHGLKPMAYFWKRQRKRKTGIQPVHVKRKRKTT
jgi:hypothetical protein